MPQNLHTAAQIHDIVRKRHRASKTRNSASKKTIKVKHPYILPRPDDCENERPLSNAQQ